MTSGMGYITMVTTVKTDKCAPNQTIYKGIIPRELHSNNTLLTTTQDGS